MTGGQNYVVFWTLRPNLSSRLGNVRRSCPPADSASATAAESSSEAERAPASNEMVSEATKPSAFSSAEKAMAETFTCGVAIGCGGGKAGSASAGGAGEEAAGAVVTAVTGTASGAIAVWKNLECVKMVLGVHGATAVLCLSPTYSGGFVSGGADGNVCVWDNQLNVKGSIITIRQVHFSYYVLEFAMRGLGELRMRGCVAVWLYFDIVVSLDSGDTAVLVDGPAPGLPPVDNAADAADAAAALNHTSAAVAASPKDADVFLTAAPDGYLRRWSAAGRRLTAKLAVGATMAAVAAGPAAVAAAPGIGAVEWTPKGSFAVCGLTTGDIVLVSPDGDMSVLSR
ncbi:unnamed protein product [Ectocarpus sp. CCAP 1310/34]|nr:unnamed protein product [Ectocarpus sp. CCAP 1310/34]